MESASRRINEASTTIGTITITITTSSEASAAIDGLLLGISWSILSYNGWQIVTTTAASAIAPTNGEKSFHTRNPDPASITKKNTYSRNFCDEIFIV